MATRLNHSPEGKMMLFEQHLVYEIKMLHMTYLFLQIPAFSGWTVNALIESFCIHVRNLIQFFDENYPQGGEDVCAQHFTDNYTSTLKIDRRLIGKLNAQITHLSYNRAATDADKIDPGDRRDLLNAINDEISHFVAHLKQRYRDKWPVELTPDPKDPERKSPIPLLISNTTGLITGGGPTTTCTPSMYVAVFDPPWPKGKEQ
jgi:hypothetical protein